MATSGLLLILLTVVTPQENGELPSHSSILGAVMMLSVLSNLSVVILSGALLMPHSSQARKLPVEDFVQVENHKPVVPTPMERAYGNLQVLVGQLQMLQQLHGEHTLAGAVRRVVMPVLYSVHRGCQQEVQQLCHRNVQDIEQEIKHAMWSAQRTNIELDIVQCFLQQWEDVDYRCKKNLAHFRLLPRIYDVATTAAYMRKESVAVRSATGFKGFMAAMDDEFWHPHLLSYGILAMILAWGLLRMLLSCCWLLSDDEEDEEAVLETEPSKGFEPVHRPVWYPQRNVWGVPAQYAPVYTHEN